MASTIPGPARNLVRTITRAVDAATSGGDATTYDSAAAQLAGQPTGGRVLGDVLRALLEDTHPEGLDADDITTVTGRCYRTAATWLPPERVDVTILLAVLAGALGIHPPTVGDETPAPPPADEDGGPDDTGPVEPPSWPDYAWYAPLLVADLLPYAPAILGSYLEAAFAEYAREAREESP